MDFNETIKRVGLKWAAANAIALPGEIVETQWEDWKHPHKVMIYEVGCCLSAKVSEKGKEWEAVPEMFYIALRLKPDGTPKDRIGTGIVLEHFKKADGRTWKQSHLTINHGCYHWIWKELSPKHLMSLRTGEKQKKTSLKS